MFVSFQATLVIVKVKAGAPLDFFKWWMALCPSYAILLCISIQMLLKYRELRKKALDLSTGYASLCDDHKNSETTPHDWFKCQTQTQPKKEDLSDFDAANSSGGFSANNNSVIDIDIQTVNASRTSKPSFLETLQTEPYL